MSAIETYLHQGWTISEAAQVLAHGSNAENNGYLLTLVNATGTMIRECFVKGSVSIEKLLARELVPMAH